jgi:lysylphosphatidylglycerol synthetase-like protein (DUF2156 family)
VLAGVGLTLFGVGFSLQRQPGWVAVLPPAGLFLAMISGWAWIRITATYYAFIQIHARYRSTAQQ